VNELLLPSSTKTKLYKMLRKRFPMRCAILDSISTTDQNLHVSNPPSLQKKQNIVFFHFLTLCRQRNKAYLCHWTMIEMLAYKAKGFPPMATALATEH
jgi:hypothetical protein